MGADWRWWLGQRDHNGRARRGGLRRAGQPLRLERLEQRELLSAAPVAENDWWRIPADQPALLDTLLDNDRGDAPVTIVDFTAPDHGRVIGNDDGTLTYIPDTGFVGGDAFVYTIADAAGRRAAATVQLTVESSSGDIRTVPDGWVDDTFGRLTLDDGTTPMGPLAPLAKGSTRTPTEILTALGGSIPLSAAGLPLLHSLPGATVAIFLDFDGWDWVQPYDVDGSPATFNAAEQATIVGAWRDVATEYATFNVDVTTEQPNFAVTSTNYAIIGNNISGGYSYLTFPSSQPWAYNNSGDARGRTTGISHEVGHNFGLPHQSTYDLLGNKTQEYSSGDNDLHVPLMGVDFAGRLPQFYLGHSSSGPDVLEDEVTHVASRIDTYDGAGNGFRADDFGGTIATATALSVAGSLQSDAGIIEKLNDVDVFSFTSNGSPLLVSARPDYPSALDLKLEVYDAAGKLLAAEDGVQNGQDLLLTLPAGTYYASLASHGDYGDIGVYQIEARPMPAGWNTQDIGRTSITGYSTYDSAAGAFALAASGYDIWSGRDDFRYTYRTLNGDGQIVARVAGMSNTDGWAKAGVMIRETLDAGARNVFVALTPSNGVTVQWRTAAGGSTYNNANAGYSAPHWVRLTRSGSTFTAERSSNGTSWSLVTTTTVAMSQQVYIGLALTSHDKMELNQATFDNVALSGNIGWPSPSVNALPAPAGLTLSLGTGTAVNASWNAVAGATGYLVERSEDNVNWSTAATVSGGATSYSNTGLFGSMRYFYRVRAIDASGQSVPSLTATVVNRPSAVTGASVTSWKADSVILNWTDTSGDTGYRVERSTDGVNFATIQTLGANVPTCNDTGRTANTRYYYRITPLSPQGDGAQVIVSGWTRLPDLSGLVFTSKASDQMALQWNSIAGATSYLIERSTDGSSFATLATVTGATSYVDTEVTAAQEYYYRIWGVNANTRSQGTATIFAATPAAVALPLPWHDRDIGNVGGSGATAFDGETFVEIASGGDIWTSQDAFRFTYRTLVGNGQITVRVPSLEDTDGWAKVGPMMRDSLDPGAANVMVRFSPDNGVGLQWRTSAGGGTSANTDVAAAAPQWLRLTRSGSTFTAARSTDGVTWVNVGSAAVNMASTIYVGLAVTSHNNTLLNTTTFDNVTVSPTGNTPPVAVADRATLLEDSQAEINVLANDSDANGHALSVVQYFQGSHGSVTSAGGILTYTPAPGFVGNDSFLYTITDGYQGYDTAAVDVRVLGLMHHWRLDERQGLLAADSKGTAAGTLVDMSAAQWTTGHYGGGLSFDGVNDYVRVDSDLSQSLGGTATLAFWVKTSQTGGTSGWDAPGVTGVELNNGANDIQWGWLNASGRMSISVGDTIGATTNAPVNNGQWHHVAFTRNADSGATQVYVDGLPSGTGNVPTGPITTAFSDLGRIDDTGGTPRYFAGALDDVRVYNYILQPAEIQVLAVNGPPVAVADVRTTSEDTPVGIDVLANDSDPEGAPLSVTAVFVAPAHGRAEINADRTITYAPEANWFGDDQFTYRITDSTGQHGLATVTVHVAPVNDPPTAVDDAAYANPNAAVEIDVLGNDSDVDLDTLVVSGFTQGANGAVTDNHDGTLTYTPRGGFVGADSFSYTVGDGHGLFDTARVAVGVGTQTTFSQAVDTYIRQVAPTQNYAASPELNIDSDDSGGQTQALLRFDNLFGPGVAQIPEGATIHRATLQLVVTNAGNPILFHRMLRSWAATDTWTSLANGIQADGIEAAAAADVATGAVATGTLVVDVTASLQNWAADPAANFGWAILPSGTDGVDFYSAQGSVVPRLVVQYIPPPSLEPAEVAGCYVFYNNSSYDGNGQQLGPQDDAAVAVDKTALRPGQTAAMANYTSYDKGINGILLDVDRLADPDHLDALTDFTFKVGNQSDISTWSDAPPPLPIVVREGSGVNGATRVMIGWADHTIENQWMQVTVNATAHTGLTAPQIFYFGNAIGESGNQAGNAIVNATDEILARNYQHGAANPAAIDDAYDYNRDGLVNGTDQIIARNHQTNPLTMLRRITAPEAGSKNAAADLAADLAPDAAVDAAADALDSTRLMASAADWLYEFQSHDASRRTAGRNKSREAIVDRLLATDWA